MAVYYARCWIAGCGWCSDGCATQLRADAQLSSHMNSAHLS